MLRFAIAFLLGLCCIHSLPALPACWPWAWIAASLLCTALLLRSRILAALVIGAAWAWFGAASRLHEDLPAELEGVDLLVRGAIASLPDASGTDPQFEFAVAQAPQGVPSRIRLSWYDAAAHPAAGETWQFVVRLKRRNGFANPGGYDYEAQLFRQGIGATGYVRDDSRNQRLTPPQARYAVLRMRSWLAQRMREAVGETPMLGILQGLAVGETQAIPAAQWRVFTATGMTHLMAISGLHITMVAALAAWAGGHLVRWRRAQRLRLTAIHGQVICGVLAALGYSLLAGMSIPTQRTLAMLCVAFAARTLRREWGVDRTIALALLAILLVDPFAPLSPGAWLSFGAVAVILLATAGRRTTEGVLLNFTRVQFAVTVGLLPAIIAAFGSLSLLSPLTNALAVPLFTLLIVPLVLAGTLLATFSLPAGGLVLGVVAKLLEWIWPAFEHAASLPLALWHFPALPAIVQAALVIGALAFVLPGIAPTRIAAALLCLPALVWQPAAPREGGFSLAVLDVGQGLATVVRTRSHVLVFDGGPAFRSGRDTGEMVVLPYLRSQGVRALDALVISHGDLDHQGGMASIVGGVPVKRLLVGPSVTQSSMPAEVCAAGQAWQWDGIDIEILHPDTGFHASDNETSCVLRVSGRGGSALLTGDIQRESEAALVSAGLGHSDIVVAPHHGSRTSSTQAFVDATVPQWVLFAAGYRNRWGFPKPDVVERWQGSGARVLSTQTSGAIEIDVGVDGLRPPREFRQEHPRYWRAR
ncbi:MAG TPA: DNA internalization-related competence protein ComEC/Rec2 [Povalibacter sp.]|uniref:DNA internalization-related competence protein ComEC/Rec2 n=1 Tax=Povalibacter sp. TaxID=1962978 RepID=UPI002C7EF5F6|nr:DNA internalization-related competence protein ComEC/Rec2 [Povalibacter sp.]HMN44808.1 DNA internalization-related competence protein ComEC/Rec2 [Povalibacter sp.]